MDTKLMVAAAFGAILLAFAGVSYANGWHMGGLFGGAQNADLSNANSTQVDQFWRAVATNDYATAKSLHGQYGMGGRMFTLLNETTFADFSRLYNAKTQLMKDLGLNNTNANIQAPGFGGCRGSGFMHSRGRN